MKGFRQSQLEPCLNRGSGNMRGNSVPYQIDVSVVAYIAVGSWWHWSGCWFSTEQRGCQAITWANIAEKICVSLPTVCFQRVQAAVDLNKTNCSLRVMRLHDFILKIVCIDDRKKQSTEPEHWTPSCGISIHRRVSLKKNVHDLYRLNDNQSLITDSSTWETYW